MWINDNSNQNLHLLNNDTEKNLMHPGPLMVHVTKSEKKCSQFALQLFSENPNLKNLKTVGVNLEPAIYDTKYSRMDQVEFRGDSL